MKLTQADIALSACIRERADWTCERCGYISAEGQMLKKDKRMQHSHFIGRKHKSTRYMPENGFCLCASCHADLEESPGEHTDFVEGIIGNGMRMILDEKKHQVFKPLGGSKAYEKGAAKFYREQMKIMLDKRSNGVTGRIEFESYA